jgi:hypothetical protein
VRAYAPSTHTCLPLEVSCVNLQVCTADTFSTDVYVTTARFLANFVRHTVGVSCAGGHCGGAAGWAHRHDPLQILHRMVSPAAMTRSSSSHSSRSCRTVASWVQPQPSIRRVCTLKTGTASLCRSFYLLIAYFAAAAAASWQRLQPKHRADKDDRSLSRLEYATVAAYHVMLTVRAAVPLVSVAACNIACTAHDSHVQSCTRCYCLCASSTVTLLPYTCRRYG